LDPRSVVDVDGVDEQKDSAENFYDTLSRCNASVHVGLLVRGHSGCRTIIDNGK